MLRIAVCDDDDGCIEMTKQMLSTWASENDILVEIHCFNNGDALITKSTITKMDIILLDIVMPLLNGMDTARELRVRDQDAKIIFLTSSPEFALESYSIKATNYCLKPITYHRLKEILDDCIVALRKEPKHLVLKTVCGYQKIYFHDIEYIEAQNKRVSIYLRSRKTVEVTEPLYAFEDRFLNTDGFFKCHRSYLVYIPNVDYFSNTDIKTKSGRSIPIARGYGKSFQEAYFMTMFQE